MKFAAPLFLAVGKPLIAALCLAAGLALIWATVTGRFGRTPALERMVGQGVRPKVRRKQFLTRVEHETLRHLEAAFPQFRVHCQVSMGALLSPERWLARNDALWTHRHRRDHARDVLTDIAGYRTIRLSAARRPTLASVRVAITQALA